MRKRTAKTAPRSTERSGLRLITLWAPAPLVATVDLTAKAKDTDRSKWIREAMREKAERDGPAMG